MTAATDVTLAPSAGLNITVTDLIISVDTEMSVTLQEETSGTVIGRYHLPARGTVQLTPRAYFRLPTADKKLQAVASAVGNVDITVMYFSGA
jgi:hypothetical protein